MRNLAFLPLAVLLTGCAPQPSGTHTAAAQPRGQCFSASQVNSFTGTKDGNVDVRVGASGYYRLELGGGCPNINWSTRVVLRTTGGGSYICEGYDAELIVPDPTFAQRCPVSAVHAISKAQWLTDTKS